MILLVACCVRDAVGLLPCKLASFICSDFELLWLLRLLVVGLVSVDVGQHAFLQVLLLEEVVFVFLELLRRCHTGLHGPKEMSSSVDVVIRAKVALKGLAVEVLIKIKSKKALEAID